ncbi:hypothetical protein HMI55_004046 [Coelomomyces lativittatus]|nr:hypothetical protein HMI55_004046 [Coelomomyces lativittatus]
MLLKNKLKQHEEQIKLLMSLGVEPAVAEPVVAEPVVEEPIVEGESAQDKNPSTPVSLHFTTSSHEDNVPPTSDDSLLNYKRARVLYSYVASVEEGFVPSNYLEVIQEDPKGSFISTNVNLSLSRSHKTTLLTVLLDYTSVNPGELSMVVGDTIELLEQASTNSDHSGDWKLGKNLRTNEEGLFPFLFTQQLSSLSTPTTGLTYPSSSEKVKADYDFQPTSEGDLELHLGDIILVINKNTGSEGWWLGTNLNTQLSGLFPYSYTSTLEK